MEIGEEVSLARVNEVRVFYHAYRAIGTLALQPEPGSPLLCGVLVEMVSRFYASLNTWVECC